MISTLYGTLGAAIGIAQGLIRGAFKPTRVPATAVPGVSAIKHHTTELVADCAHRTAPALAAAPNLLLPLLVVGHCRAGKTTFVNTYLQRQCLTQTEPTLGADLSVKQLHVQQQLTVLQIWDTTGEKQADLLDSLFWGNAAGAIIVCNLLQADCFNALKFWQDKLHQESPSLPIVVVGVKHHHGGAPAESGNFEEEELHVTKWVKDNDSCLFLVADQFDQPSAEMAMTAIVGKAMLYTQQKHKPV
ncbi:TPA: rab7b, member RAS oncoprotein [Trebouxia sp. C0004]